MKLVSIVIFRSGSKLRAETKIEKNAKGQPIKGRNVPVRTVRYLCGPADLFISGNINSSCVDRGDKLSG